MADISSIFLFGGLAVLALGLIHLSNHQRHRSERVSRKILELKRRIDELEVLIRNVEPLTESLAIPKLINNEIMELISAVRKLDKDDTSVTNHLENALSREDDLADPTHARKLYRILKSDADIARAQYLINETARIVQAQRRLNKIDEASRRTLLAELRWAHVMVSTLSLIAQGHKSMTRGDETRARAYYKKAHRKLVTSAVDDERRPRLVRELEEMITGGRLTVSPDLMPETDYNPHPGGPGLATHSSASG